jgi:hypothetical protein
VAYKKPSEDLLWILENVMDVYDWAQSFWRQGRGIVLIHDDLDESFGALLDRDAVDYVGLGELEDDSALDEITAMLREYDPASEIVLVASVDSGREIRKYRLSLYAFAGLRDPLAALMN